jgi:serralysin
VAVYQFSALSDGQAISFDPTVDRLNFDQTTISAAAVSIATEGANLRLTTGGKSVVLNSTAITQLAAANVSFANGSLLLIGDNNAGTVNDHAANTLLGGAGADQIQGLGGNDSINGGSGNDWIAGSSGNDTLTGSGGQDTFVFVQYGTGHADVVTDFAGNSWDSIRLDASTFTTIGAVGRFATGDVRFFAGTAAHDADDRIIYNAATGQLWYDADGNGSGSAELIATLTTRPAVVASDLWVFNGAGTPPPSGQTINGTPGNDSLVGGPGDDSLNGFGGNDILDGGGGADSMDGGLGDDEFHVDNSGDVIVDSGGFEQVFVHGIGSWTLGAGLENLFILNSPVAVNAVGNDLDNRIQVEGPSAFVDGRGGNDHINGFTGADTILGGAGNDTLEGDDGNDSLSGGDGNDLFSGGFGNDTLSGGLGDDYLDGDAGHDRLVGDGGNDTLYGGGDGDDTYWVRAGTVILADPQGEDWVWADGTDWTLGAGLDNLGFFFASDGQNGTGNELDNIIDPKGMVNGGTYHGLSGNDTLFVAQHDGQYFGDDGDDVLDGWATNGVSNNGGAQLFGGNGNDTLIQGGSMTGGAGADSFVFITADARTINDFTSGVDRIHVDARGMATLGASGNFTASDARFFAGTAAHDADDRIIFDAGTGSLWYDADGTGGGGMQLIAHVTGDVVATDIAVDNGNPNAGQTINGTPNNDSLLGGAGDDTINGFAGNDTIDGGAGADSMVGGSGDDLYFVSAGDLVVEAENGGTDEVRSDLVNYTLPDWVNNLTLLNGAFEGHGNDIDNRLVGNSSNGGSIDAENFLFGEGGNDTLLGGGGNDTFTGGAGSDHFWFDVPGPTGDGFGDAIRDFGTTDVGAGGNIYAAGVDKIHLDARFMSALGASGAFAAGDARFHAAAGATSGHDSDDRVVYNTSNGDLWYDADGSGSGGAALIAHVWQTPISVAATDIIVENGTTPPTAGQTIIGTAGNDSLVGGTGNDSINGGSGNDSLAGGAGNDSLTGSGGQDTFIFREFGAANADRVTDFATNWDRIQVDDAAFTAAGAAGRLASGDARFFAGAAAHDADDRFVFNAGTGQLYYDADGSGAGAAQLVATVQAGAGVAAGDITVI